MASRELVRLDSVLRSVSSLVAAVLLMAPVAGTAAKLSQVRIGTHEDHTRIVLELDEAASYRLTPPAEGSAQLQIQLDADSAARHVASRSPLVKAVRVTPSARGATVFVDLSETGVGISEMILADPPRIVLDLSPSGTPSAAQAAPAAPPSPRTQLEAAPKPAVAPEVVATRSPSLSDPVPSDIAKSPSEVRSQPAETSAPARQPARAGEGEKQAATAPPAPDAERSAGSTQAAPPPSEAARAARDESARPSKPPAEVIVRRPGAAGAPAPSSTPAATDPTWIDRLSSPAGYAAIGVVLLALVVFAVRRRRQDEDDDPLYSVMAADDAGADADREHASGVEWDSREGSGESYEDPNVAAAPSFFDDEPVYRDGAQQLSLARGAESADESDGPSDSEPADEPGSLFREPDAAAPLAISDEPAPSFEPGPDDVTRLAAELGDRVQELERRLEQLTEARERLERQVTAQTEELRVQRAAIARTQRVVRSITKGEELATEPVPRAPQA